MSGDAASAREDARPTGDCVGFFYCGHCDHVASLPEGSDPAETFKCPRCKKHAVRWRFQSQVLGPRSKVVVPVPAGSEVASAWFRQMREVVG